MILGCHVHYGSDGLYGSVKEALSYNANALMIYTGAPQNTIRSKINLEYLTKAQELIKTNNISKENIICHAPYIINLANKQNIDLWNFSISFLKSEIKRCQQLGIKYIVIHPGSYLKQTKEEGLNNIVEALKLIVNDNINCMILLETMAGKGTECGRDILELKYIIDGVNSNLLGICLDTCHLNDSGVDLTKFDDYLNKFTKLIGINKIKCIHLNDSKNEINTHKDRHENIGYGTIGFNNLLKIAYNPILKDIPKILETPYISIDKNISYPPYKFEIEMIKNKIFNFNLKQDVLNYYK